MCIGAIGAAGESLKEKRRPGDTLDQPPTPHTLESS